MYTKKVYKLKDMLMWTRFDTLHFTIISSVFVLLYQYLDFHWFKIPWTPLALIGTAVAFVIGFQNNSAYGRIWEARKIWGGIVNTSRTFGMFVQDMVTQEYCKDEVDEAEIKAEIKTLTYRHIAWMTALRHSMRVPKPWETSLQERTNREWQNIVQAPEKKADLADDLRPYISEEDMEYVLSKNNKQTALLYLQSKHLRRLKEKHWIWEFSFLQLESVLEELFTLQGKSERIKNFPYPRHFATLNHYFTWIFIYCLPLGLIPQFSEIGQNLLGGHHPHLAEHFSWFAVPFAVMVSWVFHTMERIGRTGENPFEGGANDVPISTISRGIEIDLRQNLGENKEEIPAQFEAVRGVQF